MTQDEKVKAGLDASSEFQVNLIEYEEAKAIFDMSFEFCFYLNFRIHVTNDEKAETGLYVSSKFHSIRAPSSHDRK